MIKKENSDKKWNFDQTKMKFWKKRENFDKKRKFWKKKENFDKKRKFWKKKKIFIKKWNCDNYAQIDTFSDFCPLFDKNIRQKYY